MYKENIPIFFTIDESYAPYAGVAIKSLIENASKNYNYKIIVLHENIKKESIEKIAKLATQNCKIEFHTMEKGLETITDRVENKLRCDYFTLTIFFRLFIADMFPEYDKGIYLDSDIVVPGDISELYNIDLENNMIGASRDHSIQEIPELQYYAKNAIGKDIKEYINSGILLLNLKMMREKKFSEKFLHLLNKYHFDTVAPDQDYLNAICMGKVKFLDETWDAMPNDNKKPLENPNLIHYNLFAKPWCYDNIQYEDYFWKYAKNSEFYNTITNFKNNYSDEQKLSDTKSLNEIIGKAGRIPDTTNITFKKIYESGEDVRV